MGFQPLAIRLRYRAKTLGRCIPPRMDGLHGNRRGHAFELRQNFEATIEKQPQVWLALMQFTKKTGQGQALGFARGFG
ncbi:hypothetical protein D3C76_1424850 [compost metagenome]